MSACTSRFDSQSDGRFDLDLIRRLVELTQSGLPLVDNPWAWIGERLDLDEDAVLDLLRQLQDNGAIRRIAAVPNHYRLGYKHNGMTVWDVDDAHLPRLGPLLGSQPFVSHCYRRPPPRRLALQPVSHGPRPQRRRNRGLPGTDSPVARRCLPSG